VSGSDCGNIFFWDKETEAVVQFAHGDDGGVVNTPQPHPFFPIMATSGLDHDAKIWMPTAQELPDFKAKLEKVRHFFQNRPLFFFLGRFSS
jgi:WD repeat-containing protein 42A